MLEAKIRYLRFAYTAVFTALICAATYLVKIPVPPGYYHVGDAFIYLAGVCLPFPYAAVASALGAGLSDLLGGYPLYVIPTMIIKTIMILTFTRKSRNIICKKNIVALVLAAVVLVAGYYVVEVALFTHSFTASLPSIYGNLAQAAVSSVLFVAIGIAFDKLNLRKKIFANVFD